MCYVLYALCKCAIVSPVVFPYLLIVFFFLFIFYSFFLLLSYSYFHIFYSLPLSSTFSLLVLVYFLFHFSLFSFFYSSFVPGERILFKINICSHLFYIFEFSTSFLHYYYCYHYSGVEYKAFARLMKI